PEIVVEPGEDVLLPKVGCSSDQIMRAGKALDANHLSFVKSSRLFELPVKDRQFFHIIVGRHLAEQVGGAERKADDLLHLALERNATEVHIDAGASDHVLDLSNVGDG